MTVLRTNLEEKISRRDKPGISSLFATKKDLKFERLYGWDILHGKSPLTINIFSRSLFTKIKFFCFENATKLLYFFRKHFSLSLHIEDRLGSEIFY
jgi:hypothetical protein